MNLFGIWCLPTAKEVAKAVLRGVNVFPPLSSDNFIVFSAGLKGSVQVALETGYIVPSG